MREKSFALGYRVRMEDNVIAVLGQVVYVVLDPTTRSAIRLPDDFREALARAQKQS
jgi:acyl-CoA thioesterase FadM